MLEKVCRSRRLGCNAGFQWWIWGIHFVHRRWSTQVRYPSCLWNPGWTSPEVQNRVTIGHAILNQPTELTMDLIRFQFIIRTFRNKIKVTFPRYFGSNLFYCCEFISKEHKFRPLETYAVKKCLHRICWLQFQFQTGIIVGNDLGNLFILSTCFTCEETSRQS